MRISNSQVDALVEAINCKAPVEGLTHTFYKYPARFSPQFAEAAIRALTTRGDVVLDPFMGGGTSVVESIASGRRVIACDLNPLAGFITTSPLLQQEESVLVKWQTNLGRTINLLHPIEKNGEWSLYERHVPWWLRKVFHHAARDIDVLQSVRARMFARCSLVKTAQWALDCRSRVPGKSEFLAKHAEHLDQMLRGSADLRQKIQRLHGPSWRSQLRQQRKILVRSAAGVHKDSRFPRAWGAPKLILTSPPYAGVHILYNRWQVRGRRETGMAYGLIRQHARLGATNYTFAGRQRGMEKYLDAMRKCYSSIVNVMDHKSLLVQLVAFSEPNRQLPAFERELQQIGLAPVELIHAGASHLRLSREVPNRKWYADVQTKRGASQEYLLIHKLAS
jgi:hypothetical protein